MSNPAFSKTSIDSGMRAYDMHALDPERCPEGTWYRSVTSCLKAINKPALINWAGKVNREALYANYDPAMSPMDFRALTDKPHHNIASKGAADVGTLVHAYAEGVFGGAPFVMNLNALPTEANRNEFKRAIAGFEAWRKEHKVEVLWTERTLWLHPGEFHPTLGVCGTFDCGLIVDGQRLLVDIKTSADVYPEHWLQVATGLAALDARGDDRGFENMRLAVLTVGKNGTTKLTTEDRRDEFNDAMRAAMTLADYLYGPAQE